MDPIITMKLTLKFPFNGILIELQRPRGLPKIANWHVLDGPQQLGAVMRGLG